MTRTLVTGGTGYVGTAVVRQLRAAGGEVALLDADVADAGAVAREVGAARFDAVVHLAARTRVRESVADPLGYSAVNLGGPANLLAALDARARATGRPARLVFASTGAVYGAREGCLDESEPAAPAHPYAAAKYAAEQLIGFQAGTGRLAAITLRCFNVAGALPGRPDPDPTRLISRALAVAAGAAPALPVNGDGSTVREYTHLEDVAAAFALAVTTLTGGGAPLPHQVFNVGSGVGTSIAEVVAAVERVTGRPVPIERRPAAAESAFLIADSGRIRSALGWAPTRSDLDRMIADSWAALVDLRRNGLSGVSKKDPLPGTP